MSSIIGQSLPASWEKDGVKISKQPDEMTLDEWREALYFNPKNTSRIPDQTDPAFIPLINDALISDPYVLYALKNPSLEQVESAVQRAPDMLSLYMDLCRRDNDIHFNRKLFKEAVQALSVMPESKYPVRYDDVVTSAIELDFKARGIDAIPYWESVLPYLKSNLYDYLSPYKLSHQSSLFEGDMVQHWSEDALYHMVRIEPYSYMVEAIGGLNQFTEDVLIKLIDQFPMLHHHLSSPPYPLMLKIIEKMTDHHMHVEAYNLTASYNMRKTPPENPIKIGLSKPSPYLADDNYGIPGLARVLMAVAEYPSKIEAVDYEKKIRPVLTSIPFGKSVMNEWQQQTSSGRSALDSLTDLIEALDYLRQAGNDEVKAYIDVDSKRIYEGMNKQLSIALDRIDESVKPHDQEKPYEFDDRYTL